MIKPYGNRIIVKPIIKEAQSEDGIQLVSVVPEDVTKGVVIANSVTSNHIPNGMIVIFSKYAGEEIIENGETIKIINVDEILAYE